MIWAFLALAGGGAATAGTVWWKHRKRRKEVVTELDAFKQKVVGMSDELDKLQERHKMLPFVDDDYQAPMTGKTLAAYESVQAQLDTYREKWLNFMEVWDKSQTLVDEENIGRSTRFEEAKSILNEGEVIRELDAISADINAPLDRLANAHEIVAELLNNVESSSETLVARIEELEQAEVSTEQFQNSLDDAAELTDEGKELQTPDPLSARECLEEAQSVVAAMIEKADIAITQLKQRDELTTRLESLEKSVEKYKTDGFKFPEPELSPVPHIEEATRTTQAGAKQLTSGRINDAVVTLELAANSAHLADESIQTYVDLKQNCLKRIDEKRRMLTKLLDRSGDAGLQMAELERNFSADSWISVADNATHARELTENLIQLTDEARDAAADEVQQYARALIVLDQIDKTEPQIVARLDAIDARLVELNTLRDACHARISELKNESNRIGVLLRRHTDDRPLCNHRYEMANDRLEKTGSQISAGGMDWSLIHRHLDYCAEDFSQVEHLLNEDLRKAQEARAEITKAETVVRKCRSFYRSGVSTDVTNAELRLRDASGSMQQQDYERAVELANNAEQIAHEAYDLAVQKMEAHQRQLAKQSKEETMRQIGSLIGALGSAALRGSMRGGRHRRRW